MLAMLAMLAKPKRTWTQTTDQEKKDGTQYGSGRRAFHACLFRLLIDSHNTIRLNHTVKLGKSATGEAR